MGLIENFLEVIRRKEWPLVTGLGGHRAYEQNVAELLSLHRQAPVSLPLNPEAADAERARNRAVLTRDVLKSPPLRRQTVIWPSALSSVI